MSESALWGYVRDKLLPPGIHATRIESRVSPGFPDVDYCYKGRSGNIELKFLRKKNLPFGEDGLNRDQLIWIPDRVGAGGIVWILAQVDNTLFMVTGALAEHFNSFTRLEIEEHARWIGVHRHIDSTLRGKFISLL